MNTEPINVQASDPTASRSKKDLITTVLIFVLSIVSAGIGFLILFVPEINAVTLCYIFCGIMVCLGIVLIAKFFAVKAFQKFHDYSFSLGVLMVVLGCIGFIRVENLAVNLDFWVGFIVLCIGIFMLQCSIQLKLLGSIIWLVDIILTALIMVAAILILIYWQLLFDALPEFPYWSILIAGGINVLNFPVVLITVQSFTKRAAFSNEAQPEDADRSESDNPDSTQTSDYDFLPQTKTSPSGADTVSTQTGKGALSGNTVSYSSDTSKSALTSTSDDDPDNTAPLPDLSDML